MNARPDLNPPPLDPAGDLSLYDHSEHGLVEIARGDPRDLAAMIMIQDAHDWRPQRGLMTRSLSDAWPKGGEWVR